MTLTAPNQYTTTQPSFPVDAHVHFHQRRFVEPTLESAAANFSRVNMPSSSLAGSSLAGALLLTESSRERIFEGLGESAGSGRWKFRQVNGEPQTIVAEAGEQQIAIVCGRQVRCAGGLEVLALGTTARFPAGRSAEQTIEAVRANGALAVLPWGFGKWAGRAGRTVRAIFRRYPPAALFAGDNGGRLQLLGMPGLLREAHRSGLRILPGTDPFPFARDYRRVGAFGFLAAVEPDPLHPWRSLREWLEDADTRPQPYGTALHPLRFMFNQGWIQVHNRFAHGAVG